MVKKIIRSDKVWQHKMTWSYGALIDPGSKIVMVSGAIPVDRGGNLVGKGDMKAQITQIVKNMEAVLEAGGATLSNQAWCYNGRTDSLRLYGLRRRQRRSPFSQNQHGNHKIEKEKRQRAFIPSPLLPERRYGIWPLF